MFAEIKFEVLCGHCKVPLETVADSEPERSLCLICGIDDTSENALGEAGEHAIEVVMRHSQSVIEKAVGRGKGVHFAPGRIPDRSYRFISDLKP
jgi:hypothetical protein